MNLRALLSRSAIAALALLAAVETAPAANLSFSTGTGFLPGPRLIDGSDLNVMVDAINNLVKQAAGTLPFGNLLIGTGVNEVSIAGGATGVDPVITVGGASADTNIGLLIAGKGTGPLHLGGTDKTNGSVRIPTVASAVNSVDLEGAATLGIPFVTVAGLSSDTNASLAVYGKGTGNVLIGGGTTTLAGLQVAPTTSAVNGLLVTPGATGTRAAISAATAGADTNIGISIAGKGTGTVLIGGSTTTLAGLQVAQTASAVNDLLVTNGATGTSAAISANSAGADTNAGITLTVKGSGKVALGGTTTCSGTTTATCQGQRFIVSITGLTTAAAGTESAAMTVTNASVLAATDIVHCQVNIYAGTGNPIATRVTPGTGSVSLTVTNVAGSGSLNATVPVACVVF